MAYQIVNPLGVENLEDIFKFLSGRLMEVVIPVAVLLYVWAGVNLLVAAGRPDYIKRAKDTFKNTTVGLLVIFIGGGFVDFIKSIIDTGQQVTPAGQVDSPSDSPDPDGIQIILDQDEE